MNQLFSEQDKTAAYAARNRLWWIFGGASFAWAAACAAVFVFRYSVGYGWAMFLNIALTALYGGFVLFFFSIKFKLTHSFIKMLKGFDKGLREERVGFFTEYDMTPSVKDGVNCYTLVTGENYNKHGEQAERRIMVECTRTPPDFQAGDRLHYYTHANFLVEYEVYPRHY
ncbi:MAG: hypothetical protein LBL66_08550 [Clostridiales bacterium]|jgi:hypothetical protein|nr:hypothetical protein [Clostridiales bacterium]